jgi:hypothetical protein
VLGDNIYENGVTGVGDPAFQSKFDDVYKDFKRFDFWVVPGNHDWHQPNSVQAQVDYSNKSDRWRMPSNHYSVPNLPAWIALYGLDTTVMYDQRKRSEAEKKEALAANEKQQVDAALKALQGRSGWRLLFGHHPVYSTGEHGYADGGVGMLPYLRDSVEQQIIKPASVPVYFSGHDHHQELLHSANPSYYQVVQGAAGKLRWVGDPIAQGVERKFACAEYGFALAHVTPDSMRLTYYGCGNNGKLCREIYAARLTLSSGGIGFEQIPTPGATCMSGPPS